MSTGLKGKRCGGRALWEEGPASARLLRRDPSWPAGERKEVRPQLSGEGHDWVCSEGHSP